MKSLISLLACCVSVFVSAQEYTSQSIFAHNDYATPVPFHNAYHAKVGFIEADVFLQGNNLAVAHTLQEVDISQTLENLYLKPLSEKVKKNKGYAYYDQQKKLCLMIDLKTEGISTLNQIVLDLEKYPELKTSPTLQLVISGNVPDTSKWKQYPSYISFDGRPGIRYSEQHLKRVAFISDDLKKYSSWNGKGKPIASELAKLERVRDDAHRQNKKIRFWGAPDFENAWLYMMRYKIDIIGTDRVQQLAKFINDTPSNTFFNQEFHNVYHLQNRFDKKVPKNIILMIGDGTGLAQLYAGYSANKGQLNIFNIPYSGHSITVSADSYITDSAAGATAMASGTKTNNRYVGVDPSGNKLVSIAEDLSLKGFFTAMISTGDITDATPASFYAHQSERSWSEPIADDFTKSNIDVLMGGGLYAFASRKDGKDMMSVLQRRGYGVERKFSNVEKMSSLKIVSLDDSAAAMSVKNGRKNFLERSVLKTLSTAKISRKPFFVMAEAAQVDHGGHANNLEYVIREVLDFDRAVGEVLKFIDQDKETLLIVTADHETGGLTLLGGDLSTGYVRANFSTFDHTGVMVPVFAYGPGAEKFIGVYQNTEIYRKMAELLKLK